MKTCILFAAIPLALLMGQGRPSLEWQNRSIATVARAYAIAAKNPEIDQLIDRDKCEDCGGTGKVGDGVVEAMCLRCDGTGKPTKQQQPTSTKLTKTDASRTCDVSG